MMYDIYDNDFDKAFDEAVEAIEKKEHRLIWADKLKKHYSWWQGGTLAKTLDEMKRDFDTIVDLQPTVEAEPIKHGRWIGKPIAGYSTVRCSVCRTAYLENAGQWDFCPNCGARMDEVENG